jgi:hypothetical protein
MKVWGVLPNDLVGVCVCGGAGGGGGGVELAEA